MSENCQMVVFSNKAYNAIIRESFDKDPVETGGILLGHVLDNGIWIVMEVLPPGIHCIFERAYFEYDDAFVNYLAQSVANQYKTPLELLGLWHRHPGSMDFFSSTDDQTNTTFAAQNRYGVISGLVNIDPQFRLTMYHLDQGRHYMSGVRPVYEKVAIEVGDDIIPEEYFELRYYDGEDSNLHPRVERTTRQARETHITSSERRDQSGETKPLDIQKILDENMRNEGGIIYGENGHREPSSKSLEDRIADAIRFFRRNRFILILLLVLLFGVSLKVSWNHIKSVPKAISEWIHNKNKEGDSGIGDIKVKNLEVGQSFNLSEYLPENWDKKGIVYTCDSQSIRISKDKCLAISPGEAIVSARTSKGEETSIVKVIVNFLSFHLNYSELSLIVGEQKRLRLSPGPDEIIWRVDNPSIVDVASDATVVAISEGETNVRAIVNGAEVASCIVHVSGISDEEPISPSPSFYTLEVDNGRYSKGGTLHVGQSHTLKYKTDIPQQELSSIVWESSNPSVASIDSNGRIRALQAGETIMTVKYNDISSSWKLTVKAK